MNREEVEDLLADALHPNGGYERVPSYHLAALCRAWLALDASDAVEVEACCEEFAPEEFRLKASIDLPAEMAGQRVRVVVEDAK